MRPFLICVLLAGCTEAHTAPPRADVHDAVVTPLPAATPPPPPAPAPSVVPRAAPRAKRVAKKPRATATLPIASQPEVTLPPPPVDPDAPLPR